MRLRLLTASTLAVFAACAPPAPASDPPASEGSRSAPAISESDLFGRWRIVSVDGRALATLPEDRPGERTPHVAFSADGYGGNSGCNSFGGLGLLHGNRYYGGSAMQTAIGCGDLTAQESAIIGVLASAPLLRLADGQLTLSDGRRSIVLRRAGDISPPRAPWRGPQILGGTQWVINEVDGQRLGRGQERRLQFEADRWSLAGPCGTIGGGWRQRGRTVVTENMPKAADCTAGGGVDARLLAILSAHPGFATGPNGEFLIGGGDHWAQGERPRSALRDDSRRLAGAWRIVEINGAPPLGNGGAQLAFGANGYSGSAGCNSLQGYYLAHARRFFSAPPIQTEMACGGGLNEQEAKVGRILTSSPAIAISADGSLELMTESGGLSLRRDGDAPWSPQARLWDGEALEAELTMLGGWPLQEHVSQPETRLRLSAERFDIATGCGRLGGVWRRRDGELEFFTDAEPEPNGACAGALASRLQDFMRMFNGPARVQIGASGELLMAGEHQWLAGRVLRPRRGK